MAQKNITDWMARWLSTQINGAARVRLGDSGLQRGRLVSVTTDTLPVLATSGVATWLSPGVTGLAITGVRLVSGTVPLTGAINWNIRYATDPANDAASAIALPTTVPSSSATLDIWQGGSFNVTPIYIPDTEAAGDLRVGGVILPYPIEIPVDNPIFRFDLAHNIGGSVVLQFTIQAVEAA